MERKTVARSTREPKKRPPGLWRWHLWAGLAGLLVLLLAGLSGVLLVYQKELVALVVTPRAELPADYGPVSVARELEAIAVGQGLEQMLSIKAPSALEPYWTLRREEGMELLSLGTLETYSDRAWFLRVVEFVRQLHVDLFASAWGEAVLLVSGLLALFLCISGLVLWWPGRRRFHWRWVLPGRVRPSQLLQYHRHAGALASPLLLLILFTGSLMLWQKLVIPVLPPAETYPLPPAAEATQARGVAASYLLAQAQVADGWPTYIRIWPEQGGHSMKVRFRLPDEWHLNGRTSVQIRLDTGDMRLSERADQVGVARNLVNQLYPLHSGFGMNGVYRLLSLAVGLALCWLSVTGGWHYLKRWRRSRGKWGQSPF